MSQTDLVSIIGELKIEALKHYANDSKGIREYWYNYKLILRLDTLNPVYIPRCTTVYEIKIQQVKSTWQAYYVISMNYFPVFQEHPTKYAYTESKYLVSF